MGLKSLFKKASQRVKYAGQSCFCPICQSRLSQFLPFGSRDNAQCPVCGSLERHRLLWLYLKEKTNFFQDQLKVLDIAPMDCLQEAFQRMKNIDYLSADLSSSRAMVKMDITDIKLPDNQFDVIICYHVLEHIPDDQRAMRELYRVLKPGSWAILQVPIEANRPETFEDPTITTLEERERVFGQKDHVRIYGQDYQTRLKEAKFRVKAEQFAQELKDSQRKRFGLRENNLEKDKLTYRCFKSESEGLL